MNYLNSGVRDRPSLIVLCVIKVYYSNSFTFVKTILCYLES